MIPPSLQHLLDLSMDAVRADLQHALRPIHRQSIYSHLGPTDTPTGHRTRARLALLAAQHVLPIWQRERPEDNRAKRILGLAEDVLHNTADTVATREEVEAEWRWLTDDHGGRYEKLSSAAYSAYGAIVQAAFAALEGDTWDHYRFEDDETDADIDIWSSDVAKWAVNAVAGPVWKPDSDAAKRLEFWTWWLNQAVPAAWEVGNNRSSSD